MKTITIIISFFLALGMQTLFCQTEIIKSSVESLKDSVRIWQNQDIIKSSHFLKKLEYLCSKSPQEICELDSLVLLKGNVYLDLARFYQYKNMDSSRIFVQKSYDAFEVCSNIDGQMSSRYLKGSLHFTNGTYTDALKEFRLYVDHYKAIGNLHKVAKGEYKRASCYQRMGVQDSSIVICHRSIKIFEKEGEKSKPDLASCYQVVGLVYLELKQSKVSEEYLKKALSIYRNTENLLGQAKILTSLGNNVYESGDTLGCIRYYKESGLLTEEVKNNVGIFVNYFNIANVFFQLSKYDSSLVYVEKANQVKNKLGRRHKYMIDYKKGAILIEMGNMKEGIPLLEGAFNTSVELNSFIDARDMSRYLNHGYESLGDYSSALKYSNLHSSYKDSVINIESNKKINEIKIKYETEKKEIQINHLEKVNSKQRQSIIIGGVALLLISFLSYFLFSLFKKVKGQKEIISKSLAEKDILLREIHHRVKNNLQLISSLLTLQGRSIDDEMALQAINESKNRVRSMALIHQDLYNKENLTGIGVKDYLEKLTEELFSTYRIPDDRVELDLEIEDLELDVDTLIPLGLIINELITNCLKYAFPDDRKGLLLIKLYEKEEKLMLNIKDNGIGYDPQMNRPDSFGSTLISALTAQLDGEKTISSKDGTNIEIVFRDYISLV